MGDVENRFRARPGTIEWIDLEELIGTLADGYSSIGFQGVPVVNVTAEILSGHKTAPIATSVKTPEPAPKALPARVVATAQTPAPTPKTPTPVINTPVIESVNTGMYA